MGKKMECWQECEGCKDVDCEINKTANKGCLVPFFIISLLSLGAVYVFYWLISRAINLL